MADPDRGTGRTTQQMRLAPPGAVFIWCNDQTSYPRGIAKRLGRLDLHIEPLSALEQGARRLLGKKVRAIVLDHAAALTDDQRRSLDRLRAWASRPAAPVVADEIAP